MDISIVVDRDPDGPTLVTLYIDGVDVTGTANVIDIDPGAGYDLTTWRQIRDRAIGTLPETAAASVGETFDDYASRYPQYITGN